MRIETAAQTSPWLESLEMDRLLEALGHPDAMVTNESCIGDFISGKVEPSGMMHNPYSGKLVPCFRAVPGTREEELAPIAEELKLDLKLSDYLIDVCALMRGQAQPN